MTEYVQDPPFCIQVELTLGCNLNCSFCGIQGIGYGAQKKGLKHMTTGHARAISSNIAAAGWNSRIEFARRGEPTMNPNFIEIISIFRKNLPNNNLMLLCNGAGILNGDPAENIKRLYEAGINTIAIDDYDNVKILQKIFAKLPNGFWDDNGIDVYEYPQEKKGNPHQRRGKKERVFSIVADISSSTNGTHSAINNHGGYAAPAVEFNKPCAKPFRELSINYDGTINHCCIAWAGELKCGNALQDPIEEIWNNERFDAVRRKLLRGERDFGTCKGCDHPSYRVGLLPDKLGKHRDSFPKPDDSTRRIIGEMLEEGFQIQPTESYFKNKG